MRETRNIGYRGLVLVLIGLLQPVPSFAADIPVACPSGLCSGLGQSFYLPNINVLDPREQTSGSRILKDTSIGSCATVTLLGTGGKQTEQFQSTSDLTKSWSAGLGLGKPGDLAGGTSIGGVTGLDLQGTASVNSGRTSTKSETFNSLKIYQNLVASVVDLNQDSNCFSVANLDPAFLADFEGLPLSDAKNASENSTWADYRVFLERWGSHVQIKQELGSQYSFWGYEDSSEKLDMKTLQANLCAKLGAYGLNFPLCLNFSSSEKLTASQKKTVSKLYVTGGDTETRNALLQDAPSAADAQTRMDNFIKKASVSDQAVGFKYTPVWGLLTTVYRQSCGRDGVGSKACGNFQRAVNLQAAYEGFLAYQCVKSVAPGGLLVQGMMAEVPNGNGIYYYACQQARTGCHSNNDCSWQAADQFGPFPGQASFCGGGSCVDAQLIDGTSQYRSYVRPLESPLIASNDNVGVNASCRNDRTATCDLNWGGGKPERQIWVQSTGGGGSGTFGARAKGILTASATDNSDPSSVPETQTIKVEIIDGEAHTANQVAKQAHTRLNQFKNPDINTIYVTSIDSRSEVRINCGGVCTAKFLKDEEIQLLATASVGGHVFMHWSDGICSNQKSSGLTIPKRTCIVKVKGDLTVQAHYQ